jgi:Mg2+ and Co2+ transporter CorA
MTKNITDQIVEYQQSQQEAAEALSQAQSRVAELQALLHRQTGAITALQRIQQDQATNGNGAVELDAETETEEVTF